MDIENFLSSAHAYAETSKRTYRDVIPRVLANVANPVSLTASELLQILSSMTWGNARQRVALAAVHKYLAWTYGKDHPALSAKIKRVEGKLNRCLDANTANQLLASFNTTTAKGVRDLALASLMLDTGLRESEVCRLQQADTDTEKNKLQVIVKGGNWAFAVFSPETCARLEHWKAYRKIADGQGFLFTNIYTGRGLTPMGLYNIVEKWGQHIGIKLSPHDFRRTFATLGTTLTLTPARILQQGGRWGSASMIETYTKSLTLEAMRNHLIIPKLNETKS